MLRGAARRTAPEVGVVCQLLLHLSQQVFEVRVHHCVHVDRAALSPSLTALDVLILAFAPFFRFGHSSLERFLVKDSRPERFVTIVGAYCR